MNLIQLENDAKLLQRNPHFYEHIDVAIVADGFGKTVGIYSIRQLTKDWLRMGVDYFKTVYGFNWEPSEKQLKECRRRKKKVS